LTGLDRVILLINDMTIKGTTRVQKYGFLTSQLYSKELSGLNFYTDWVPYRFGPNSQQLSQDLSMCIKQDLVDEQVEQTFNNRLIHNYTLKIRGRAILRNLMETHDEMIKILYEKFTELNRKSMSSILKDIYEAYPKYTVNSEIKDEVLNNVSEINSESNLESKKLNPEIEDKLELIRSGNIKGRKYTSSEYLQHIDQILED